MYSETDGTTAYLYVPEGPVLLARRWLEEHGTTPVRLLVEGDQVGNVEAWRRHSPGVEDVIPLGQTDWSLPDDAVRRVVVPLSTDAHLLHFHHPVQAPALGPHYALFRRLWSMGFREITWYGLSGTRTYGVPHMLDEFRDRHRGQRCFVVGNGPSLAQLDMPRLKDEITLGSNRCFLGYEKWGFPFTYWGIYDRFQIEQYGREYETSLPAETTKFFPLEFLPLLRFENACPLNVVWSQNAAHDFSGECGQVFVGYTVTHMLLQIAAVMGCDPIVLIGADHRYVLDRRHYAPALRRARRRITRSLRGGALYDMTFALHQAWRKRGKAEETLDPERLWCTDNALAPTHFDDRYAGGEQKRFLLPEPEEAERDFACARAWAERHGIRILNATPGSALDVFEHVTLADILDGNRG